MIATVAGDIGPVFGVDEPIFCEHSGGGAELIDIAADTEDPTSDAKFTITSVGPITGILNATDKAFTNGDIAGGRENVC